MERRRPVRVPPKLPDHPTTQPSPEPVPPYRVLPNPPDPPEVDISTPWGRTIPFVYGTAQVDAIPVARWTKASWPSSTLCVLYAVAYGPVSAITGILFGDLGPTQVGCYSYSTHLGTLAQTLPAGVKAVTGTDYPGFALVYCEFVKDEYSVAVNPARMTCTVTGFSVDPRTDPTLATRYVRSNPALAWADYMINARYGPGVATTRIDWNSVEDVADWCDEQIGSPLRARFAFGYAFESQRPHEDHIELLRAHGQFWVAYDGATYRIIADKPRTASGFTLRDTASDDKNNLLAVRVSGLPATKIPNRVVATWTDPTGWRKREIIVSRSGVEAGDIPEVSASLHLPGCQSADQARRHANYYLNRSLLDLQFQFKATAEAMKLDPGMRFAHTGVQTGFTDLDLLCTALVKLPAGAWSVSAERYDAAVYSDTVIDETSPVIPPADPSLPLDDVVFTLSYILNDTGAPSIAVDFTVPDSAFYGGIDVRYRLAGDSDWISAGVHFSPLVTIPVERFGEYEVNVRTVNWKSGARSTGTTETLTSPHEQLFIPVVYVSSTGILYDWELPQKASGWTAVNVGSFDAAKVNDLNRTAVFGSLDTSGDARLTLDLGVGNAEEFDGFVVFFKKLTGYADFTLWLEYSDDGSTWSSGGFSQSSGLTMEVDSVNDVFARHYWRTTSGAPVTLGSHRYWRLSRLSAAAPTKAELVEVQLFRFTGDPYAFKKSFLLYDTYDGTVFMGESESYVAAPIHRYANGFSGGSSQLTAWDIRDTFGRVSLLRGWDASYSGYSAAHYDVTTNTTSFTSANLTFSWKNRYQSFSGQAANFTLHGAAWDNYFGDFPDHTPDQLGTRNVIVNNSSYTLTIKHNSGTEGTAACRFTTPFGTDVVLAPGESCAIFYDNAAQRTRVLGAPLHIAGLTEDTAPVVGDSVATHDASAGIVKRATLSNLLKVINGLTEDTTPDAAADFVATYDASASGPKKVKLDKLGGGSFTTGTFSFTPSGTTGTVYGHYAYSGEVMQLSITGTVTVGASPVSYFQFTLPASKTAKYGGYRAPAMFVGPSTYYFCYAQTSASSGTITVYLAENLAAYQNYTISLNFWVAIN